MDPRTPIRATVDAEETLGLVHSTVVPAESAVLAGVISVSLFVHGRAGKLGVMAPFYRACSNGSDLQLAVQAPLIDPIGGFSWWLMDEAPDQMRMQIADSVSKLIEFIHYASRWYGFSPQGIVACGFSQGAALLSLAAQREPALFSRVALLAGFVLKDESSTVSQQKLPRFFVAHGTEDTTVSFARAEEGVAFLQQRGAEVTFISEPVGHKVGSKAMAALRTWMADTTAE
jgi:predicted esterase